MRKSLAMILIIAMMTLCFAGCGGTGSQEESGAPANQKHVIGVIAYNKTEAEMIAFSDYLNSYVKNCFEDVDFVYAESDFTFDNQKSIINTFKEQGVEGILCFSVADIAQELDLCKELGIYYIVASGTISDEEYASVAENPYFMGVVGPGLAAEHGIGQKLATYCANHPNGDDYIIFTSGSGSGNIMHLQRTIGVLETLEAQYITKFEQPVEELAASSEITHVTTDKINICICPGYLSDPDNVALAAAELKDHQYGNIICVTPLDTLAPSVAKTDANVSILDCFTDVNLQLFNEGTVDYVAGKYASMIAPSFALIYNAVTGYAEDFKENGKALQLKQDFWEAEGLSDYIEKYTYASSAEMTAYNFADLYQMCKAYNPKASVASVKTLGQACSYSEAVYRRSHDQQ